jgi:hypothetical protein
MIDPNGFATQLIPIEIIDRQHRAPLVLITQKRESFTFASIFIPRQHDINYIAVLGENYRDVALVHEVVQAPDVDVRRREIFVPRTFVGHTELQFTRNYVVYHFG